jgi:hypothetical protein
MDDLGQLAGIADGTEGPNLSEQEIALMVAAGGGKYVGLLERISGKIETVVLFASPQTRTTLGLPISRLTVEAVCELIAKSDEVFARGGAR